MLQGIQTKRRDLLTYRMFMVLLSGEKRIVCDVTIKIHRVKIENDIL